jgi:hypothetical protein
MDVGTILFLSTLNQQEESMSKENPYANPAPAKFALGHIVSTLNAYHQIPNDEILHALTRHRSGDWGTLEEHDRRQNEQALQNGGRLVSAYQSLQGIKFWIITEADRTSTCVLLPEDY